MSCPHYLAEILIYLGLALLCGQPEPLTYMALLWVVSIEKGTLQWLHSLITWFLVPTIQSFPAL